MFFIIAIKSIALFCLWVYFVYYKIVIIVKKLLIRQEFSAFYDKMQESMW